MYKFFNGENVLNGIKYVLYDEIDKTVITSKTLVTKVLQKTQNCGSIF
jgi:hypothetical protein